MTTIPVGGWLVLISRKYQKMFAAKNVCDFQPLMTFAQFMRANINGFTIFMTLLHFLKFVPEKGNKMELSCCKTCPSH